MPNMIAYGALLAWPLVTLVLMLTMRTRLAVIWCLLGGYMLLPIDRAAFDFKAVPTFDKTSIPNLSAFLLALALGSRGNFRWPRSKVINVLALCYIISPIFTGFANTDPIPIGDRVIPAMDLYTSVSKSASNALQILPLILGAGMFRDEQSHRDLLIAFTLAGLAYSLPVLAEIRLSPFLQSKVYGIDPGGLFFAQQVRDGGFRAMVFLGHGLLVSTFLAQATIAATGLWRAKQRLWILPTGLCALYLFAVLLLNKSAGAIVLTILVLGLLTLLKPRRFLAAALLIATMVVVYPMLRAYHLVPTEKVEAVAQSISEDRARSLNFRVRNEEMLLDRANHRPLLGWGAFSRNRVYAVTDRGSAQDVSITDGTWIIMIGIYGWIGYLAVFGLLCYPFWHMFKLRKWISSPITPTVGAMLLLNLIDLLPNSSLRPITWLVAGALSGFAIAYQRGKKATIPAKPPALAQAEPKPA